MASTILPRQAWRFYPTSSPAVFFIEPKVQFRDLFGPLELPSNFSLKKMEARFMKPKDFGYELPKDQVPEAAFFGRSNVGKSSLINAVIGSDIMVTSQTPGRTRMLNFAQLTASGGTSQSARKWRLVDLPGYGYARVARRESDRWQDITRRYFQERADTRLTQVFFLLDVRRPLDESDVRQLQMLDKCHIQYQIVLTKWDKVKRFQEVGLLRQLGELLGKKRSNLHNPAIVATSAVGGFGLEELRLFIASSLYVFQRSDLEGLR